MNIYLARHGTTEWNSMRLIQGRTDIPLDDTGRKMAEQSGRSFADQGIIFDKVFSSPLKRALETAELLSCKCMPPAYNKPAIITDERLTELCFGEFEGQNTEEMFSDPTCPFRFFKNDPLRYNNEIISMAKAIQNNKNTAGGLAYPYEDRPVPETLDAMLDRTACFIDQVIAPFIFDSGDAVDGSQIENILICGHGALNRALLMNFRGINDLREFWGTGLQPNCGITKITCTCDDRGRIIYDVQDECMVLYDKELEKGLKKLL